MQRIIGTYGIDGQIIEYSIAGKGEEPVLFMHGGHSNCHEEFGYHSLTKNDYMLITPSRAGYGETAKEIGESLSKACYYYVELLNYLGIEQVHVIAISAGGPSGLCFASLYPERVKTLTLQSAVTKEWHTPKDTIYKLAQILFHPLSEQITWKLTASLSNLVPKVMFKLMAPSFSTLSQKQIRDRMGHKDISEVRKMNNRQQSGDGFLIDLLQTQTITARDLKAISSPVFIMHSNHDGAVPLEHAYYANQQISGSQLCILDSWGHLIWLGKESEKTQRKLIDFLSSHPIAIKKVQY